MPLVLHVHAKPRFHVVAMIRNLSESVHFAPEFRVLPLMQRRGSWLIQRIGRRAHQNCYLPRNVTAFLLVAKISPVIFDRFFLQRLFNFFCLFKLLREINKSAHASMDVPRVVSPAARVSRAARGPVLPSVWQVPGQPRPYRQEQSPQAARRSYDKETVDKLLEEEPGEVLRLPNVCLRDIANYWVKRGLDNILEDRAAKKLKNAKLAFQMYR